MVGQRSSASYYHHLINTGTEVMGDSDPASSVQRGKFYCDTVVIQVEKSLHKVPRNHLTEWSQVFRDMFELPQTPDAEGGSDDRPIHLPGCTNFEFESLLEILLTPGHLSPLELSKEQWIAGLKLSTMWDMQKIRSLSIEEISCSDLTSIEKMKLGRLYKVKKWIVEGCTGLVEDADNLSLELLSTLGWETAARVAWVSREYAAMGLPSQGPATGTGSIPPSIWVCGNCNGMGFQSGYCYGCRTHVLSISVDMGAVVVTPTGGPGGTPMIGGTEGKLSDLVLAAFEDELSQMSG